MSLQQTLIEIDGHTPFEICKAIRTLVVAALREDLPNGLYPFQIRFSDKIILAALAGKGDEIINNQARQSGKTETIVVTLITLALYFSRIICKHFRVGIFAPAATQSTLVVKERLRRRFNKARPVLSALGLKLITGEGLYSELFIIRNIINEIDFRVRCLSIGETSNITSETFNLIIIEQSEDVDPMKMQQEVFPMAAAVGGARILDGTPKNEIINTYFYDACTKRKDVITVDYLEAGKANPLYLAFVEKEKERLGEDSIAFRTQYLLQWAIGVDKFTTLDQMIELSRKKPVLLPMVDGRPLFMVGAGWDVGKKSDRSVCSFGWKEGELAHLMEWLVFEGDDYPKQADYIALRCMQLGASQICVDSAGVGDPVVDILKKALRQLEGGVRIKVDGIMTNNIHEDDITSKLMVNVWREKRLDFLSQMEAAAMGAEMRKNRDRFIDECVDINKIWKGNMLHLEAPKGYDRHDDYPKSCGLLLRCLLNPPVKLVIRELGF